jgi:hypothetical protein
MQPLRLARPCAARPLTTDVSTRPRAGAHAPQRLLLARPCAARPVRTPPTAANGTARRREADTPAPTGCCWHGPAPLGRYSHPQRLLLAWPCPPTVAVGTALHRRGPACTPQRCCWHGPALLGQYPRPQRLLLARRKTGTQPPTAAVGTALRRKAGKHAPNGYCWHGPALNGCSLHRPAPQGRNPRPPRLLLERLCPPNGCCWHSPAPQGQYPRPQRLLFAGPCAASPVPTPPAAVVGTATGQRSSPKPAVGMARRLLSAAFPVTQVKRKTQSRRGEA